MYVEVVCRAMNRVWFGIIEIQLDQLRGDLNEAFMGALKASKKLRLLSQFMLP